MPSWRSQRAKMASIFGGYRMQVYHEVAQRIALALKGSIAEDGQGALVPAPLDHQVCKVLKEVPGLVECAIPEQVDHEYVRRVTMKRAKRNAVRFIVMRKSEGAEHFYIIRPFTGRPAAGPKESPGPLFA